MNRALSPEIKTIDTVELPPVTLSHLDNGVPVYTINAGEQDVVKVELLFKAGKWYEPQNLVADFTNRMLREGTSLRTAKQLADAFDDYGANVQYSAGFEHAGVTLYALTNRAQQLFPLLHEVLTEAVFPESELATILNNRKQKLKVELEKNDYVANRHFMQALFGPRHPYGRITQVEDLDRLNAAGLKAFYESYYHAANLVMIVSGKFDQSLLAALNRTFGGQPTDRPVAATPRAYATEPATERVYHTEKPDSVQSAIILGNHSINKLHPDFMKVSVLNTLFGGYFGSRLMSNIREDKGYTYGIYSSFVSYPHAGFLEISAEVGKDVREATLTEIANEIHRLKTEPVSDHELRMVKNYLSGKILRSVDGPLKFSETLKGLITYRQSTDYIHQLLHTIKETTAEDIQQLALKYLDYESMYKVTVG